MIGKIINYRYEVLEKCGDGSFFSVYKARDKVLNRLVAVKVLSPQYAENCEFAERMISEAQSVTDLNHPHIGKVFESDSMNGVYFTTVEYVRGMNLKERIRRASPFPVSYAVDIALAVAHALDYAHKSGVVHGDIRPHNILTSPEGQVKLTDFGTAQALSAFPEIREATALRSVRYQSPEVIRGEPAQPESDIYSLGVVLFEMLTGSVPYDGTTSAAVAARQLQDKVPSTQALNAGVPAMLNEIVMKAMHKDPSQRYSSAAEFAAALGKVKEWLRTGQTPAWPPEQAGEESEEENRLYRPDERSENFLKTAVIMLLAVLGIAIATSIIVIMLTGGLRSNELRVPDLIGKTFKQAEEIASRTGLQIQDYRREFNEGVPEGQIYLTNPKAGSTVPKERPVIQVWISKGPKMLIVPNVVGMSADDARRRIADVGFVAGQTLSEYSDSVVAERVIRQTPLAGQKLEPLSPVDVVVSLGPEPQPIDQPEMGGEEQPDSTGADISPGSTPREREFTIDVNIPAAARQAQNVQIKVTDAYGETVAYEDMHQPGDSFSHVIRGFGEDVEIRVYVGSRLVQHVAYSGDKEVRSR